MAVLEKEDTMKGMGIAAIFVFVLLLTGCAQGAALPEDAPFLLKEGEGYRHRAAQPAVPV